MFHRSPIQAPLLPRDEAWDWPRVVLGALILAGCLLRLLDPFYHNPAFHLFSDPLRHWDNARMPLAPGPMGSRFSNGLAITNPSQGRRLMMCGLFVLCARIDLCLPAAISAIAGMHKTKTFAL